LINRDERFDINVKNAQSYGIENPATFKVLAYKLSDGIEAVISHFDRTEVLRSSMQGFFNLYNLLAITAAVKMLTDAPLDAICEELGYFGGVSGRMEVISEEPLVIVDFAHTHDGIKKVVESFPSRDVAVVFGAGGDRDSTKRPLMGKAAAAAKKIYLTSDNPRSEEPETIIEQILQGVHNKEKVRVNPDREEAIAQAIKELESGEVLLILGKGDETHQEIQGKKIPMSDKEIIQNLL
jgi:UDP-N-acetylmuramoyl-L-alanyl-D-glutamate--2,6-diaminopimelate ligase